MTFLSNGILSYISSATTAFIISLLLVSNQVLAIDINRDLPITIESDRAEIDDSTGVSSYQGNVHISQGGTQLKADNITVIAVDRVLTKIVAIGAPASFEQRDNRTSAEEGTSGQAEQITYIAKDALLLFEGQAQLSQQTNSFSGERIEYDIMRKAIKAKGDEDTGKRVRIKYFPNSLPDAESESVNSTSEQAQDQVEKAIE